MSEVTDRASPSLSDTRNAQPEERWFVKEPCKHCPFRRDVKPFLHPSRAEEIAYLTENRYSEFHCHKTLDHDDEDGETFAGRDSLICAGFLSMQIEWGGVGCPDGFTPSGDVYSEPFEMIGEYEWEWENRRAPNKETPE